MALTIASNNGSFLSDGSIFFYLADTCWSAFTNISNDDWEYYLQYRKRQGYNVLQINILPQWDASATSFDHHPFAQNKSGGYQFEIINPSYFEHAKSMCEIAKSYGFELALVVLWCNYVPGTWANNMNSRNTMAIDAIDHYVQMVDQTFSSFNPIYVISGDTDLDSDVTTSYYYKASDILRKLAPNCLQTFHIKGRLMEIPEEVVERSDFYMFQSGHNAETENLSMSYRLADYFRLNYPKKPLINSEPCYEQMGYSRRMYGRFHTFDIRRAAWLSLLSGASAGITYGAAGIYSWHVYGKRFEKSVGEGFDSVHPWHTALHFPGAWDYGDIRMLMEEYNVEELIPIQEVVLNGDGEIRAAKSSSGNEIFMYVPENTNIRLDLDLDENQTEVLIIDLETRHKEIGKIYYEKGICCVGMHLFNHDVLYIIKRK